MIKNIKNKYLNYIYRKSFTKNNYKIFTSNFSQSKNIVLVEFNNFQCNHIGLSYVANELKKKYKSKIISYYGHVLLSYPLRITLLKRALIKLLSFFNYGFFGIYKSFGVENVIYPKDNKDLVLKKKIKKLFYHRVKNLNDLQHFSFNNILLGDLIYDTYLKSNHDKIPTIDLSDNKFNFFVDDFIELFTFWYNFFKKNSVKAVIASHSCYTIAIPLRIGLNKKIDSYVLSKEYLKKVNKKYLFQNSESKSFKKIFYKLNKNKKNEILSISKKRIESRISGQYSGDYIYITKSPYKKNIPINQKKSKEIKVVIFTHDFADAPHALGFHLFPDFYTWLKFTLDLSKETEYKWYVKTHPRFFGKAFISLDHERLVTKNLLKNYPKITLLPNNISHNEIINRGINAAITVAGTVAMEYAFHNILTINASMSNPHRAFNFNIHPKTIKDYKKQILNIKNLIHLQKINKNEIYQYYAIRNIFFSKDWIFKNMYDFAKKVGSFDNFYSDKLYEIWLKNNDITQHNEITKDIKNFIYSKELFLLKNNLGKF
jgi:hypothetical protein